MTERQERQLRAGRAKRGDCVFNPVNGLVPLRAYAVEDNNVRYLVLPDCSVYIVGNGRTEKEDLTLREGRRIYEKLYAIGSKARVNGITVISDGLVFS